MRIDLKDYRPVKGTLIKDPVPTEEYNKIVAEADRRIRESHIAYGEACIRSESFLVKQLKGWEF